MSGYALIILCVAQAWMQARRADEARKPQLRSSAVASERSAQVATAERTKVPADAIRARALVAGVMWKRGSGEGLFGTTRWQKRYVAVADGHVFYYEKESSAEPTRVLSLVRSFVHRDTEGLDITPPATTAVVFVLETPLYSLILAGRDAAEATRWCGEIDRAIAGASGDVDTTTTTTHADAGTSAAAAT